MNTIDLTFVSTMLRIESESTPALANSTISARSVRSLTVYVYFSASFMVYLYVSTICWDSMYYKLLDAAPTAARVNN